MTEEKKNTAQLNEQEQEKVNGGYVSRVTTEEPYIGPDRNDTSTASPREYSGGNRHRIL